MAVITRVTRAVTYTIHYKSPGCFDDGGVYHDKYYSDSKEVITAANDRAAQAASLQDRFWRDELCHHGRRAFTTRIVKTVVETTTDGFRRVTTSEVPLPRARQCPCGKRYWPVLGESNCHELTKL